ncbi:MAG: hypothetical protein ACBR13_07025 [Microcoleus sp.]
MLSLSILYQLLKPDRLSTKNPIAHPPKNPIAHPPKNPIAHPPKTRSPIHKN